MKRIWLSAMAISTAICSASLAQVTGSVKLEGKAPQPKELKMAAVADCAKAHNGPVYDESYVVGEKGELKNVVVSIKGATGEAPKTPAVLDQKGCIYTPHVLPMMVGQEWHVSNSDAFLHNVHGLAKENGEFNFPQQNAGDKKKMADYNKAVETFKVKCDIHPWMSAWIVVLDTPFFAATSADGKYSIDTKGLKDGKYTLVFWHEKLGTQEAEVEVKDGKAAQDFAFKSKLGAAASVEATQLVSAPAEAEKCLSCCEKDKKTDAKAVVTAK